MRVRLTAAILVLYRSKLLGDPDRPQSRVVSTSQIGRQLMTRIRRRIEAREFFLHL